MVDEQIKTEYTRALDLMLAGARKAVAIEERIVKKTRRKKKRNLRQDKKVTA